MTTPTFAELDTLFRTRRAKIGIIGLGYVGLPLALVATEAGFPVIGFDINPRRVEAINAGEQVIRYIPAARMEAALTGGRFRATVDFSGLGSCDAIVICVPTPLTRQREPDLSFVADTTRTIAGTLRPGQLIVLESTTWPGTTVELVRPILEATGLASGRDFFLAFSPEREDPGNAHYSTATIPKVVGGDGPEAGALAQLLYGQLISSVVPVSSTQAAEAVKLTENIFRSVNIALVNELKTVYAAMGVDIWEVIEAASSKPFGFMPFYPGPGLGGHCIPIDPFYLTWKAREFDIETRFIELAGQINTRMPYLVVDQLAEALDRHFGRGLAGARVLVLGAAYKKNVDDVRESPALKLMELIDERGGLCEFHDPQVTALPPTRRHPRLSGKPSIPLDAATLAGFDAVLVATDHDDVDYALVAEEARLVVDTRNVFARLGLTPARLVKA
ncbi:nucleotide sugar dehydrogenase [Ancylobacter sp. Lp-2]|uniref:nucleotide sugar dehydrogenase n=1 Tax=Ancylobacter sp. Lp-2 TaxID=2881339 RepID=UPI001E5C0BA2|nr:nucleotide sugar dehydrogenase [Ancylobacter sp. Lp-2]MCB4768290.1 nucleotide sugar dehydrogenase [Ancylobacter sp. Lp-2]